MSREPELPLLPLAPELSVAELDRLLRSLLEGATRDVRVRGEVSGLKRPGSGHVYFALKDEQQDALIDCVMYKSAARRVHGALADGERVIVRGRVTVFAARGRMQLVVEEMLATGRGDLLLALERLKQKLAAEGLFDAAKKKPLPRPAQCVAVLTSKSGAVIHDFCRVALSRGPVRILLCPTPVQGAGAAERITRAIRGCDRLPGIDALVIARGGGSLEDLAAYNDERVVRAIAACRTPVVTAIGHEMDVSLADLAADARAATASQAAELLVADQQEQRTRLGHLRVRLRRGMGHRIDQERAGVVRLGARLTDQRRRLHEHGQRIDEQRARLDRALQRALRRRRDALTAMQHRLDANHPKSRLQEARICLTALLPRLQAAGLRRLGDAKNQLASASGRLDALSPLGVLGRGYAIATRAGRVLRDPAEVAAGDAIDVRLHRGVVGARVEKIRRE